jgi:hypothetical protein
MFPRDEGLINIELYWACVALPMNFLNRVGIVAIHLQQRQLWGTSGRFRSANMTQALPARLWCVNFLVGAGYPFVNIVAVLFSENKLVFVPVASQ